MGVIGEDAEEVFSDDGDDSDENSPDKKKKKLLRKKNEIKNFQNELDNVNFHHMLHRYDT